MDAALPSGGTADAAPAKYIPPHLRRQQQEQQEQQQQQGTTGAPAAASSACRGPPLKAVAVLVVWRGGGGPPPSEGQSASRGGPGGGGSSSSSNWSGSGRAPRTSHTGTGWDVRDGRSYRHERVDDVFSAAKQQSTGIKFDAYDKVPVELKGRGSERILPVESFEEVGCKFSPLLMENVARVNYSRPTPIQKNSIPTILAGRDLMACAQTGSGKTAAFLYPIIAQMLQTGPPPLPGNERGSTNAYRRSVYPVCLVLSPTRELAMQIYQEARKFQFGTGIRTVPVYGGSQIKRQLMDLDAGCDICVATPGRLADLLERKKIRLALVRYLVLDEADRMLDMGFLPQIRSIVDNFDLPSCPSPGSVSPEEGGPRGRQTIMFSATFPKEIQMLAKDFMHDYIYLAVGRVGSTNEFIRQRLLYADEDQKIKLLVNLLRESEKGLVIVFVETKKKADMIEDYLLNETFPAISIHGDRTQEEREDALRHFKSGHRPILVATDVAARGLDISNVKHVINYDLPSNIDDYVHRIGRTGRAGNLGLATSFVNEQNRPILRDLLHLLEEANQEIPGFLHPLVVSCTSSSLRLGGRGGFGRMASSSSSSSSRFGGGGSRVQLHARMHACVRAGCMQAVGGWTSLNPHLQLIVRCNSQGAWGAGTTKHAPNRATYRTRHISPQQQQQAQQQREQQAQQQQQQQPQQQRREH
ncbi:ATP-dependent RNA helicase, putative [Eimeria brunetti]|uniref:RNA helicase n=1 Tax=Eimeria brunetti TaxID=51314 RepID=U6LX85_9EIME|nr:ATP-dependent RNA helicase, putative [Eimeria brunetti]